MKGKTKFLLLVMALLLCLLPGAQADTGTCSESDDGQHSWVLYSEPATCTENGWQEWQCEKCYDSRDYETLPALGHNWSEWSTRVEATCTEGGTEYRQCSRCGETEFRNVDALGHSWDSGTITTAATCTADGVKTYTCTRCGTTRTESIPATGHTPVSIPGKAASCTESGLSEGSQCSVCGTVLTAQQPIPATGHTAVSVPGKAATCTEPGLTDSSQCSVCGATLTAQQPIPATGHTAVTVPGKAATCTEPGLTDGSQCSVCGTVLTAQQPIPAIGHTAVSIPGRIATCTVPGLTDGSQCSVCGTVLTAQQEIPATGHAWDGGTVTKEAGYLNPGETTYTCTRCGVTKTEEIPVMQMPASLFNGSSNGEGPAPGELEDTFSYEFLHIVTQPTGGSIDKDSSMLLSVEAAGGTPPYTYQWRMRYNGGWWSYWKDAENGTESTLEAQKGNYKYYCRVYDDEGNRVDSDTVVVDWNLHIDEQPENTNMYGKDSVTLSCRAAGGEPFGSDYTHDYIYSWFGADDTSVAYDQQTVEVKYGGEYYCIAEDAAGNSIKSNIVMVYNSEVLGITADWDHYLLEGENGVIHAYISGGTEPYTVTCEHNGESIPIEQEETGKYTIHITGDGSDNSFYTIMVSDDVCQTTGVILSVRYRQLKIDDQPEGRMLPYEGSVPLNLTLSEGELPLTCTVYRNGEPETVYTMEDYSTSYSVTESGEYYFHIEDSIGRWADSWVAVVTDYSLKIHRIDVSGSIASPDDSVTLTALVIGGAEPITYMWWRENERDGNVYSSDGVGDTSWECTVSAPGLYRCMAKDRYGNCDVAYARVDYTGNTLMIVQQPDNKFLPYQEGKKYYGASLVCRAITSDGNTDSLEYVWQKKVSGSWVSEAPGGETIRINDIIEQETQTWQCVVTDTRTGEQIVSGEAIVGVELTCAIQDVTSMHRSSVHYIINGGQPPYTVKVYERRILSISKDNEKNIENVLVKTVTTNVLKNTVNVGDSYYNYPWYDKDELHFSSTYPDFYIEVTDSNGQWAASEYYSVR